MYLSQGMPSLLEYDWLRHVLQQALLPLGVESIETAHSLIQTSRAMREAVLTHCTGLPLKHSATGLEHVARLAAWLSKYGSLLASLELRMPHSLPKYPGVDEADRPLAYLSIGNALQQAAHNPCGLRMQSCKLHEVDWGCCHILEQLPVNALTSLKLRLDLTGPHDETECVRRLQPVKKALGKLQQLRKLSLAVDCFHYRSQPDHHLKYVDPLLQPSSTGAPLLGLTNLTSLKLNSLWCVGLHTPTTVYTHAQHPLELEYHWEMLWESAPATLELSHLTALTKLTTGHQVSMFSNAQLPTSLQHLQCGRLADIRPLQPLSFLQRLDILSSRSTAAQLARLSSLTQLTQISLAYMDIDSFNRDYYPDVHEEDVAPSAAAVAWPMLASKLRELHISELYTFGDGDVLQGLTAAAVAALGSLSTLTSLRLSCLDFPGTPPEQFAAALRRCTALQHLQLEHLELQWTPQIPAADNDQADADLTGDQRLESAKACGMQSVTAAIASLPRLQQLSISRLPLTLQATAQLTAAAAGTQLTQLHLVECGVTAAGLSALALGLQNMKDLEVRPVGGVDAAVPALGRLPLQRLHLGSCWANYVDDETLDVFLPNWRSLQ